MADHKSQKSPLTKAGQNNPRTRDQQFILPARRRSSNDKKASKCIVYLLLITVIITALLLIFASIVWRITSPDLKITSVTVRNLLQSNSSNTSLNGTIKTKIAIENSNFGRFRYNGCTVVILYGNSTIGDGDITGGSVGARGTVVMDVTMKITGTANLNASSDDSGLVKLQSYAETRGKVRVMKIAKKTVRVKMNCSMSLSLNNQLIHALHCK